jgi:hypothetical protein
MPLTFRMRPRLGPFRFNLTRRGLASIAVKVGPVTRNLTRGTTTIDGPGPFGWRSKGGAR